MRKLSILLLIGFGAAGFAGCCTHRATLAEAPPVCAPIQCGGSCGCPQVTTGVPAYADGVGAPVITTPPPGMTTVPGATVSPSITAPPSLAPSGSTSSGPSTFVAPPPANGNLGPSAP
jgi:hypothetical protein